MRDFWEHYRESQSSWQQYNVHSEGVMRVHYYNEDCSITPLNYSSHSELIVKSHFPITHTVARKS